MHTQHQDDVKVAVYSANMPTPEDQRTQDVWLAVFMSLGVLAIVGLRFIA
ncbi:MAG: hypothetical protein AAGI69_04950 [Cyanobacteria bacterium P01_H01_bin.21]